ncbi:MAG: hypothetical protein ACXVB9_05695 [Bdellovibrionota bacterium]
MNSIFPGSQYLRFGRAIFATAILAGGALLALDSSASEDPRLTFSYALDFSFSKGVDCLSKVGPVVGISDSVTSDSVGKISNVDAYCRILYPLGPEQAMDLKPVLSAKISFNREECEAKISLAKANTTDMKQAMPSGEFEFVGDAEIYCANLFPPPKVPGHEPPPPPKNPQANDVVCQMSSLPMCPAGPKPGQLCTSSAPRGPASAPVTILGGNVGAGECAALCAQQGAGTTCQYSDCGGCWSCPEGTSIEIPATQGNAVGYYFGVCKEDPKFPEPPANPPGAPPKSQCPPGSHPGEAGPTGDPVCVDDRSGPVA